MTATEGQRDKALREASGRVYRNGGTLTHELKAEQPFYGDVACGRKEFEVRRADRDFHVGDALVLREWNGKAFTGFECTRVITYILRDAERFGIMPGFVVLGLREATP